MDERLQAYLATIGVGPEAIEGWKVEEAYRAGEPVGFVLTRGPEVHILPAAEKKAMSRKNVLAVLEPILEEHGYATTRVPIGETDHKLRHVLGFTQTWADADFTYWALTQPPFRRST